MSVEQFNLHESRPDKVEELQALLKKRIWTGRSREEGGQ